MKTRAGASIFGDMTASNLTIDRLSYCEWEKCDFYTLEPRNLNIHYASQ